LGALWGLVVRPLQGMIKFLQVPGRRDEVKAANVAVTAVVAALIAAAVALIPLPQRVWCAAELRPAGEQTVYVPVPGRVEELLVRQGDLVRAGQPLARLSNVDLDLEIAALEGNRDKQEARLSALSREKFTNPAAGLEIGTVKESLDAVREQLDDRLRDRERLVLVAPRDGVVLPGPSQERRDDPTGKLPAWAGNPLDARNLGAMFQQGTVLCLVGAPDAFEAAMIVDQSEKEFLALGQRADLKLDAFPWITLTGSVAEIAETNVETVPERLSVKGGDSVPTETRPAGGEAPISTSYEVLMTLADAEGVFTPGMRGTARIEVGSRTVGQWLLRLLWQTFNFRM